MNSWDLICLLLNQCWQLVAVGLAVLVAVKCIGQTRPHLAHALWSIVLLKAITPPIMSASWSPFSWLPSLSALMGAIPSPATHLDAHDADAFRVNATSSAIQAPAPTFEAIEAQEVIYSLGTIEVHSSLWMVGIWLWLMSASVALGIVAIRYYRVVKFVKFVATKSRPELSDHLEQLRQKLRLRRPVELRIVAAPISPFVMGFVRPTVVLPAFLVEGKTVESIEPLLAHELIHIRRGDLWWTVLQILARSIFWFHPVVRWAESQLTIASEQCCDQETLRVLDCAPATYARCLLNVLEQKHRLQVASALPGVRPIEITKDRLEKVMKTGKEKLNRSSIGSWLLLMIGCALLLPGAASVGVSQDEATESEKPLFVIKYTMIETTHESLKTDPFWKKFAWEDSDVTAKPFRKPIVEAGSGIQETDSTEPYPVQMARLELFDSDSLRDLVDSHSEPGVIQPNPQSIVKAAPTLAVELQQTGNVIMGGEVAVLNASKEIEFLAFGTQLNVTPNKFENQKLTLALEVELSQPIVEKERRRPVTTGVKGIHLATIQELPLDGSIAFAVPQPDRDNQSVIIIVQCSELTAAPQGAVILENPPMGTPVPQDNMVPSKTVPRLN